MYLLFSRQPSSALHRILVASFAVAVMLHIFSTTLLAQASVQYMTPTIIGGEEVEEGIYPWTVALVKTGSDVVQDRQFCGGVLIDPEWVLTAAHCTFSGSIKRATGSFNILVGATTLDGEQGEEVGVGESIPHPNYYRPTAEYDIALIRLVRPVSLPTIDLGDGSALGEEAQSGAMVLGWGRTQDERRSVNLRQVNVPIIDNETCRESYSVHNHIVTNSMICAGYAEGGKDACTGDSGGPLVAPALTSADGLIIAWKLVGIVSWGKGCAQPNAYGVYADVGFVQEWVITQMSAVAGTGTTAVIAPQDPIPFIYLPVMYR